MSEAAQEVAVKPKRRRPAVKGAIVIRVPAPQKRPWELTQDEVNLVKNHIAKGCTDDELNFCLSVARRYKLDPFRSQIWFVKRRDRKAQGGYRWIPIVGINGLLHVAARDHKEDFGSIDEPEYGPMVEVEWAEYDWVNGQRKFVAKHTLKVPEWAKVKVWKRGCEHPTVGTVYWEEIYPNVDDAPLVRQMRRLMLGKCAKAQAVRAAYPATDGLYLREEFASPDYEPSENAQRSLAKVEEADAKVKGFMELNNGKLPTEEQVTRLFAGESAEQILLQASLDAQKISGQESQKKENAPRADSEAPAQKIPPKIAWAKVMPDHDIAVSGYLPDEAMTKFLADVSAVRFKSQKDGSVYWRFSPTYLDGFKQLCQKLGIEVGG